MRWPQWAIIAGGAAVIFGCIFVAGVSPIDAGVALFHGSLGSPQAIEEMLKQTCPLLIAGIAVFIALQAGLFNIGAEGQLLAGALAAAAIGLKFPGWPGLLIGSLAGMAMGCLWALPAGLIRAYRGGHEVITTIMLNNVAVFITTAIVAGPLKDRTQETPTTPFMPAGTRLPWLYSNTTLQISSGILFGLALLALFAYWFRNYVAAYELRAVGANVRAAGLAGIASAKTIVVAMAVSGAIAGLAGAVQVFGYEHRFYSDFSPQFGFNALGVALLAGSNPWGLIPSAFFFGILLQGSASMQIIGVPKDTSFIVLGVLIAIFGAIRYRRAGRVLA